MLKNGLIDWFLKHRSNHSKAESANELTLNTELHIISEKDEQQMNTINPLLNLSETALRDLCRHHIDSFESWSRRLIDETFRKNYGSEYLNHMISHDTPLVKSEIRKRIETRVADNPRRFPRYVDAILVEDIEYFFCRDDLYSKHFKIVLEPFYSGKEEVRTVLERIIPIRNKLSHGNTISLHEAEQCLCYTDDFIQCFKHYYESLGKEQTYNVPVIIRIKDSLGHDLIRKDTSYAWEIHSFEIHEPKLQLRSGESYKLWLEVDASFDSSFYKIDWVVSQGYNNNLAKGSGNVIQFSVNNHNVSYMPKIDINLTTIRDWHRFRNVDDCIKICMDEVLPPIDDLY